MAPSQSLKTIAQDVKKTTAFSIFLEQLENVSMTAINTVRFARKF